MQLLQYSHRHLLLQQQRLNTLTQDSLIHTSDGHISQSILLVWLDSNIDERNCRSTITKLRHIVNSVHIFTDADRFVDFLTSITDEKVFLIISGAYGQNIVPIVHEMVQIDSIYIFCGNRSRHELWTTQWSKIKGIFTNISPICDALRQAVQECDQNLDRLDLSFMYTQILKETLLTADLGEQPVPDLIVYCRKKFVGNDYEPDWWYTFDYSSDSMLDRTFQMMKIDIIFKMGFFIRDLHHYIVQLHVKQDDTHHLLYSFIVDRNQGLSKTGFDQSNATKDGLIPLSIFLINNDNRDVSVDVVYRNPLDVFFVMTIDPSISSTPLASIDDVSCDQKLKDKVLFSKHSIILSGQIKQINSNTCLWQVDLTLTSDNDQELHIITDRMREETVLTPKGWYRLVICLGKFGRFDTIEKLDKLLPPETFYNINKLSFNYTLWIVATVLFYVKLLQILQSTKSPNYPNLDFSYNNTDLICGKISDFSKAPSFFECAIDIGQHSFHVYHFFLLFKDDLKSLRNKL